MLSLYMAILVQKTEKAVRHTVCTKLILITVVSHLFSDGTVLPKKVQYCERYYNHNEYANYPFSY